MKKVSLLILVSMILLLAFTSCDMLPEPVVDTLDNVKDKVLGVFGMGHEHVWTDATCESPKTCECGETEGEALGHTWVDANCKSPKTCSVCKATEGEANADAHVWADATCEAAKHCEVCGLEDGKKLGHDYADATCTAPKTCTRCGETTGKAKGHDWADATCAAPKTCKNCELTEGEALEHVWVDATCDAPKTCSGCGATEGVALGHVWVDATCTAPKTCSVCKATEGTPVAHQYEITIVEQSCTVDGAIVSTCKVCGDTKTNVIAPAPGHNFGDGEIGCNDSATCYTCGETVEAVGHDWIPANCQSPKTCKNCGLSEGIPADHILSEATCMEPAVCTICGLETEIYATHTLTQECVIETVDGKKVEKITFWCTSCEYEFPLDSVDYLDGSDYNGMTPVANTERGYITANGDYPVINKDGQYELIVKTTLDYVSPPVDPDPTDDVVPEDTRTKWQKECGQLQLWVPNNSGGNGGFNASNNAVGFLSFKFNHSMDNPDLPMRMRFVDNSLGDTDPTTGESIRWTDKWCIEGEFFMVSAADEEGNVNLMGWDRYVLKTVKADENGWTGWIDVKFGVELNPNAINSNGTYGVITVHYYIDGEYYESMSKPLNTLTFGISSVYLTGSSISAGTGLMIDDITFGYNSQMAGAWPYDIHTCKYEITDCTQGAICKVCGATKEAGEHAWISATCTEPQYCPICNMIGEPALGHELGGASCNEPASCSRPGCGFTSGDQILGHDWADATCTEPKTCKREGCGATEGEALGHDMAPATCTLPSTCTRCDATEGEPNGHTYGDATCETPATCTVEGCGATTGAPLGHKGGTAGCDTRAICEVCNKPYGNTAGHTLSYAHNSGAVTYTCTVCTKAFTTDKNYWYDGSDVLQGNGTANGDRGFTHDGSGNPEIVTEDGNTFYQVLKLDSSDQQYQIFIPHGGLTTEFADFSCANSAIGFIAFKVNVYSTSTASPFDLKLVDARGTTDWDWSKTAVTAFQITAPAAGKVSVKGYGGQTLTSLDVLENKWTGWVDVVISIQLNVDNTMTLNYYLNGKNIGQANSSMPITTHKIGAIYFSGRTAEQGSGFQIDDVAFGFSVGKEWTLGTCDHEWIDATCETPKQCKHCGEADGVALGHEGGEATCEAKAVCTRCGEEYGDFGHVADPATCAQGSTCTLCGEVVSAKLPHPALTWSYADGKATYSCATCQSTYVVDNNWYFDGTGEEPYKNMVSVDENNIYNTVESTNDEGETVDTSNPVIDADGHYTYINNGGKPAEGQGKATIWIPAMNGGIDNFEGFSCENNAIGFYSFSINAYCDTLFEMQLVDTDMRVEANRPAGVGFWNCGALPQFFKISAPDENNLVTVTGWNGLVLKKVNVDTATKFTGWFDVTVAIELSDDNTITLGYYIDGQYIGSATQPMAITSGKIDGVYFQIKAHTVGGGAMWDDVCFGYVSPAPEAAE